MLFELNEYRIMIVDTSKMDYASSSIDFKAY